MKDKRWIKKSWFEEKYCFKVENLKINFNELKNQMLQDKNKLNHNGYLLYFL